MKGIVLVGFMGTGKTTVGRILSARLGWPLMDTDSLIVQSARKTIPQIFAEEGEASFRERETRELERLARPPVSARVVSTGGGIVLKPENWPLLRTLGRVVALQAEPKIILERVGAADDRPLLAGTPEEVQQRISALLAERQAAYSLADFSVDTSRLTPAQVADKILYPFA